MRGSVRGTERGGLRLIMAQNRGLRGEECGCVGLSAGD